jgi:hypothetical protein
MVPVVIDDRLPFRPDGCRMCMTSRGRKDIWPSLVEKAVRMGWFRGVMWPIHSRTVSEAHGRVRFPWLVRQFTRPDFVAVTDGLPQKLKYGYTVRSLPFWCYA